ncbi:MAG: glycosyltransferase family 4 protein [Chitinophagaceae bacterium]|nr:glycosyltransferase family 4 protein [Chitinophagaceae bacterium]
MEGKKIKVLQGIRQGKIGGGESYLLSLVENLDRSRIEPVVLSFTDGPMIDRLKKIGIKTHVIHTETPFDVRVWKKVSHLVKEEHIDVVHAHGTRAMSNMYSAAKKKQLPLLYTCHAWSFHVDQNAIVKKLRIGSEKYLTKQADINICGAKANRDEARKLFGKFDAEIIYNSVDPNKFNPTDTYKNIRQELGIAADEIIIASIARLTLQKQPLKLITAFAEVCKSVNNIKLLMVGDGELKDKVIELIAKLQLKDRIILQPFRQDVPDLLAAADIFVLPSLWEAFPIALLEAMYMGKAVAATNVDGTPEMIEDNYNGLLLDPTNLEADLAKKLTALCVNTSLRKKLQANAIKSVYNKYNVSTLAKKNQLLYEQLVSDRSR